MPVLLIGRAHRVATALPAGPPAISADGRFVAFASASGALVDDDTNEATDVFVRDTLMNRTILVSRSRTGGSAAGCSVQPSISADGTVVAFTSSAPDLVAGDSNGTLDVFVRDLRLGRTELVSRGSRGELGDQDSFSPAISADGRFVAFSSLASTFDARDDNGVSDVYRHDRVTGRTVLISVSVDGLVGDGASGEPSTSADGRVVAFTSVAANLDAGDVNDAPDVFVRDVGEGGEEGDGGVTELVSLGPDGCSAHGSSSQPALSGDGSTVAFTSSASDLVRGDDNGSDDVFVRSLDDGGLRAVSTAPDGQPAAGASHQPSISEDGSRVAFLSDAPDLVGHGSVDGAAVGAVHAYVRDLDGAGTALVDFAAGRVPGDGEASAVAISASGGQVAFTGSSGDLAGDDAGEADGMDGGASVDGAGVDGAEPLYVAPIRTARVPGPADPSVG